MTDETSSYAQTLDQLRATRPAIGARLQEAEQNRANRLKSYVSGRRLEGLEELNVYLERLERAYEEEDELASLSFLVRRATRDFETALEATLSGYQGVAADAMRDVMEIEYLLLDFAVHEDHAAEWLTSDRQLRLRKYGPAKLRDRLKAAGLPPFADESWEPVDYKAHSESLHVNPQEPFVGARGLESFADSWFADIGFIEMFEHAWRFLQAAEMLRHIRLGRTDKFEPLAWMDTFHDARDRTREMQVIIIAMIEGPQRLAERLGREPNPAEVLQYVADEVRAKSPRAPD